MALPNISAVLLFSSLVVVVGQANAQVTCSASWQFGDTSKWYKGSAVFTSRARDATVQACVDANSPRSHSYCYGKPMFMHCQSTGRLPLKIAEGPPVSFCVPRAEMTQPEKQGEVRELFGERTGSLDSCLVSESHARITKIYCYMESGYARDAPSTAQGKLNLKGCKAKFYSTDACEIGYAAIHQTESYIGEGDKHIVCATALAEPGTGSRIWGIVGQ